MHRLSFKQVAFLPALLLACSVFVNAQETAFNFNFNEFSNQDPCRVFIGVGTSKAPEGLKVDYTVDNTPATTYGVKAGDIILTLDGIAVRSQSELLRERNKHQQGDAFTLQILRDGVEKTIQARFKSCTPEEIKAAQEHTLDALVEKEIRLTELQNHLGQLNVLGMGTRPILGVYENTAVNEAGLAIGSVIPGKGAEAAGLQSGDIVVNVDGKTVTGSLSLKGALANHKPGETVKVIYLREGQKRTTDLVLSSDGYAYSFKTERDPCKVFIGVYTSGNAINGRGARVDGVIDDTPAKIGGVQPGDVIMAFNGQAVNNHQELLRERDKSKAGDAFSLTIVREGVTMEIKTKFKSCDTPTEPAKEEIVEISEPASPAEARETPTTLDNGLGVKVFEAYPSPTFGPVNIQFEAEAVPTVVRILDIAGKTVYHKNLPRFDGVFNEQVNLGGEKAGNFVISIQQGDKVQSKQIVLMTKA